MDVETLCRETALHLFGDLRSEAAVQAGIRQVRPTVEFVAARVRAEAVAEHRADLGHRIEVSTQYENDRRVALAERDEYHRHWQDAEKRTAKAVAEAVADERQRIAAEIEAAMPPSARYMPRDTYNGMCDAYRHAVSMSGPPGRRIRAFTDDEGDFVVEIDPVGPVATPAEPRTADAWSWGGVDMTPATSPVPAVQPVTCPCGRTEDHYLLSSGGFCRVQSAAEQLEER